MNRRRFLGLLGLSVIGSQLFNKTKPFNIVRLPAGIPRRKETTLFPKLDSATKHDGTIDALSRQMGMNLAKAMDQTVMTTINKGKIIWKKY